MNKDKIAYVVHVNKELSKVIQEFLFKRGYSWPDRRIYLDQKIKNLKYPVLIIRQYNLIVRYSRNINIWDKDPGYKVVTIPYLMNKINKQDE